MILVVTANLRFFHLKLPGREGQSQLSSTKIFDSTKNSWLLFGARRCSWKFLFVCCLIPTVAGYPSRNFRRFSGKRRKFINTPPHPDILPVEGFGVRREKYDFLTSHSFSSTKKWKWGERFYFCPTRNALPALNIALFK